MANAAARIPSSKVVNDMIEKLQTPIMSESDDSDKSENHPPPQKKVKKVKTKSTRFRWQNTMVEALLDCMNELKSQYEYKGVDFESDLVELYNKVRVMMAERFENSGFGPVMATEVDLELPKEELAVQKAKAMNDKKSIKGGYVRIKAKIKEVRQDYRKAVNEGRRSGSGKIVCDNWDLLKNLWGGSPATNSISNSKSTIADENVEGFFEDSDDDNDDDDENQEETDNPEGSEKLPVNATADNNMAKKVTAKFVDNKRKMMEKNLSSSQRDQMYLNMAKDELRLKENMVNQLTQATKDSNTAFGQISESIASVGKSIGDGLALLAQAISGTQQNSYPQYFTQQQMHPNTPYGTSYETPLRSNFQNTLPSPSFTPARGSFPSSYSSQTSSSSSDSSNKVYQQL